MASGACRAFQPGTVTDELCESRIERSDVMGKAPGHSISVAVAAKRRPCQPSGTEDDAVTVNHPLQEFLPRHGSLTSALLFSSASGKILFPPVSAGKRLFSDLEQLTLGDCFYLHVLGETLAYEVTEINRVLPYETELLLAAPGEDLCTLVTCTPYGVNSHRLLVRGTRVPYEKALKEALETPKEPVRSTWKKNYLRGLAIGGGSALAAALLTASATVNGKPTDMLEDNCYVNAIVPLTVINTRTPDLPITGDDGVWKYGAFGLLLLAVAGATLILAVKTKKSQSKQE